MSRIVYHLLFGITVVFLVTAVVVLYKIIIKKKRYKKFFGLLATLIGMLGVVLSYNLPQGQNGGGLAVDVSFFSRTYAIEDRRVYKTLISNSYNYGDYELKYTIHNNFDASIKVDSLKLLVDSYADSEVELISPEGGGGGEEGFIYYYGKVDGVENSLTYLGTEYDDLDLQKDKESYVKILPNDLEAATVYFDCDKPGMYEIRLSVEYSGRTKGNYISEPIKVYVAPFELEQKNAKILPASKDSTLLLLNGLSEENEKINDEDYHRLQREVRHED